MFLTDIECNEPDSKEIQSNFLGFHCEFTPREGPASSQLLGGLQSLFVRCKSSAHSTCFLCTKVKGLVFLVLKHINDVLIDWRNNDKFYHFLPYKLSSSSPSVSGS